jgi:hypothetical protein
MMEKNLTQAEACRRCKSELETGDLRCPVCAQPTPRTDAAAAKHVSIDILRCRGCGAAVSYDATLKAPVCAFCAAVLDHVQSEDPPEQTELYLPFTVSGAASKDAVKAWKATLGWFRPADLSTESRVESIQPLFWVGWLCNAEALVSWAADSNAGSGKSSWAPHSGQSTMRFQDTVVSASRGITNKEARFLASTYDFAKRLATQPGESPEIGARPVFEQFEVQRSMARQEVLSQLTEVAREQVQQGDIPGSSFRNVHVVLKLRSLHTRRLALPAYVLSYRYRNKAYRAVVSGHSADDVIGEAPYSWAKIGAVAAGGILLILLLIGLFVG